MISPLAPYPTKPLAVSTLEGTGIAMTEPDFRAAFRQHKDAVYRFAWRMTNSEVAAEDIAQDVFLTLLRQPDRFDHTRGQLRSFLFGVARNLALKKWREESRWDALDDQRFLVQPVDIG